MTRFFSPILQGSLLCAFAAGAMACSDGSAAGSRENGQQNIKPNATATAPQGDAQNKPAAGEAQNKPGAGGASSSTAAQQIMDPVKKINMALVGFHPLKDDPSHQMVAYHYCDKLANGVIQCVLYDDASKEAKMNGIEYIISKEAFDALPDEEKKMWHPHNYEILSGQLVAPGMSDADEMALMKEVMNSYGKTFHMWMEEDKMPLGEPKLAWSFNHDGEAKPGLVEARDKKLGIDSKKKAQERAALEPLALQQEGVDALDTSRMSFAEGSENQGPMAQSQAVKPEEPQGGGKGQPAAGEKPQATGGKEQPAAGEKPQATGGKEQPAAGEKPQATGGKEQPAAAAPHATGGKEQPPAAQAPQAAGQGQHAMASGSAGGGQGSQGGASTSGQSGAKGEK